MHSKKTMNQFTKRYQAFSNPDLLKVIENLPKVGRNHQTQT